MVQGGQRVESDELIPFFTHRGIEAVPSGPPLSFPDLAACFNFRCKSSFSFPRSLPRHGNLRVNFRSSFDGSSIHL
jgi:hypothetical protein